MQSFSYTPVDYVSLSPSRLSFFTRVELTTQIPDVYVKRSFLGEKNPLVRKFHGFELSQNAIRNLRQKCEWLYALSSKKYKVTGNGKVIFNHRCTFLTLTLPSEQKHPTSVIIKECLNQFLTECRSRFKMNNYVWRLEFQKNGNAHFHILTDTFIDYHVGLTAWNRIVEKLGYISAFTAKMSAMSFTDYVNSFKGHAGFDFNEIKKRFEKGVKSKWLKPNSIDCKSIVSEKIMIFYISKYFSKKDKSGVRCNPLDNENNSKNLRLWYCSKSLSALKSIVLPAFQWEVDWKLVIRSLKNKVAKAFEYCFNIYFGIENSGYHGLTTIKRILYEYAKKADYQPSQ